MTKFSLLLSLHLIFLGCQSNNQKSIAATVIPSEDSISVLQHAAADGLNVEMAKAWLIDAVQKEFETKLDGEVSNSSIYTADYNAYKDDALGVGYDGGLSQAEFERKWNSKFNTKYAGMGTGYLISGQDFGKIVVSSCELMATTTSNELYFKTDIRDVDFKHDYHREIKVIGAGDSFLIADVKEFD